MALNPDELYDVLAINAASASTQISGLPFSGPVAGVRVALIDGPVGRLPDPLPAGEGRVRHGRRRPRSPGDDVAIMMVEAEATENTIELIAGGATAPTEEVVAEGLEAAKPFLQACCARRSPSWPRKAAKPTAEFPAVPAVPGRRLRGRRRRRGRAPAGRGADHRRQAGARRPHRRDQGRRLRAAGRAVRGPQLRDRQRLPLASPRSWSASGCSRTRSASTAAG